MLEELVGCGGREGVKKKEGHKSYNCHFISKVSYIFLNISPMNCCDKGVQK